MSSTQTCEDESVCGLRYESAFPSRPQNVRRKKTFNPKRGSRKKTFKIGRPVETVLVTFVGLSLLLGVILIAAILKLFIALRR
jgi:hypothetical protein